jgi:hypothetical protein
MPSDQDPEAHYGAPRENGIKDLRRVPVNKCFLMKKKDAAGVAADGVHVMLSRWTSTTTEKLLDRMKVVMTGLSEGMASADPIKFGREILSSSTEGVCKDAWKVDKMSSEIRTYVERKNKGIRLDQAEDGKGDIWFEYILYNWEPGTHVMSEDEVLQTFLLLQTEMFASAQPTSCL